jgi:hypothetical protein
VTRTPVFHWHGDTALIELGSRRIVIRPDLRAAGRHKPVTVERPLWFVFEKSECIGSMECREGPDRDAEIWAAIAKWLAG